MKSMYKVQLIGHQGKDPELRQLINGLKQFDLRLATDPYQNSPSVNKA